jgi:hypothetical protein
MKIVDYLLMRTPRKPELVTMNLSIDTEEFGVLAEIREDVKWIKERLQRANL